MRLKIEVEKKRKIEEYKMQPKKINFIRVEYISFWAHLTLYYTIRILRKIYGRVFLVDFCGIYLY